MLPLIPAESRFLRCFFRFCLIWSLAVPSVLMLVMWRSPQQRAIMLMASGLVLLWIVGCGGWMIRHRTAIARFVAQIRLPWQLKFVLFCTALACLEEAITTLMTNCAPLFGVPLGTAKITASTNYFDVIFKNSVIVFVPMFITWGWLLARYEFAPEWVLILFGVTGTLAETLSFGPQNLPNAGIWILVYGLMTYLPACALPERTLRKPPAALYPAATILPIVAMPVAVVCGLLYLILWGLNAKRRA